MSHRVVKQLTEEDLSKPYPIFSVRLLYQDKICIRFLYQNNTKHLTCNSPKQEQAPGIQYLIHDNRGKAGDVHISDPQKKKETIIFWGVWQDILENIATKYYHNKLNSVFYIIDYKKF